MKTIFLVIAIFVMANWHTEARAQEKKLYNQDKELVCKPTPDRKGTKCYTSKYAKNFKVCKGSKSYYICGEIPSTGTYNATLPPTIVVASATHHASKHKVPVISQGEPYVITNKSVVSSANTVGLGGHSANQVCKPGSVPGTEHCYTSKFNQNFPVCRGDKGYYICQKIPAQEHSSYDDYQFSSPDNNINEVQQGHSGSTGKTDNQSAPQSQSYKNIKH